MDSRQLRFFVELRCFVQEPPVAFLARRLLLLLDVLVEGVNHFVVVERVIVL
jgi:hypothetical protein